MLDAADLPDDVAALKAMLIAAQLREVRKDDRIERLEKLVAAFKLAAFSSDRQHRTRSFLEYPFFPQRQFALETIAIVVRSEPARVNNATGHCE